MNAEAGIFPLPENPSNKRNMPSTPASQNQVVESSGSTVATTFTPIVSDNLKPKIGMHFGTIEEAFDFYNLYALRAGFSVRKQGHKRNLKGNITHKNFACHREGFRDNKSLEKRLPFQRRVPETRIGCPAQLSLKRSEDGLGYCVRHFVEEHCHALATPTKSHLLPSHRKVSKTKKKLIDDLGSSNIRPSQQMTIFEQQSHGYENIEFLDTDLYNYARDEREETKGLDAQIFHDYFEDKAEWNPAFFYSIRKDNEDRITHVFWADAISIFNYSRFGDVVSFDSTYKTNRYDMIVALFTGVNHHGRSVVLGCGLLSNETTADFIWLFEEWQKAMSGDPPKCIITDQDLGMTKAIAQVFPHATHSYCIWHIMDKVPKYLGSLAFEPRFIQEFKSVVYGIETPQEFESRWVKMLEDHELSDHKWLQDLYELRAKWIPAYLRDKFFAGIKSTQRSETMNSLLKQHVYNKNSFSDFMLRYERFIGRQRHRELRDEHETLNTTPKKMTPFPIERQMANIFTRNVFSKFQVELWKGLKCKRTLQSYNELETHFRVDPAPLEDDDLPGENKKIEDDFDIPRKVVLQNSTLYATCSCCQFEHEGILCRHILCIWTKHVEIDRIPDEFILMRWSRNAKRGRVMDRDQALVRNSFGGSLVAKHCVLMNLATTTAEEGCMTERSFEIATEGLLELNKRLRDLNANVGVEPKDGKREGKEQIDDLSFREPLRC